MPISDTNLNKLRKKTSNITKPANRFYVNPTNPRFIIEDNLNLSFNIDDERASDIKMANPTIMERNVESYAQITYNQEWTLMNVRAWVESFDQKQLRSSLTNVLDSGVVEPADRRELVRIAVAGMVGFNEGNLYPSCQLKTQLAKDIIAAFPKLCSANGGYEHFYDPKTNRGFIEFRLKTLRLKLNPSEKKRSSSQMKEKKVQKVPLKVMIRENLLEDRDFTSKVSELHSKTPTEANKIDIFLLTAETRSNRQRQIRSAPETMSLGNILNMYPRFKDFNGELIKREFGAEYPHSDLFLDKFTSHYTPRILQYCCFTKPHLLHAIQDIGDYNLKALILLPELLPSPNYTKRKENKTKEPKSFFKAKPLKTIPNENLLQFVSDESLINEASADRRSPFLLCCMTNNERRGSFYIKADGHIIQVGDNPIVAFDVLLKMHHCFHIPFALDLVYFYDFITGCILRLNEPKGCCVALDSSLSNVNPTNSDPLSMFIFAP